MSEYHVSVALESLREPSLIVRPNGSGCRVVAPYPTHDKSLVTFYARFIGDRVRITDHGGIGVNLELSGYSLDDADKATWREAIEATGFTALTHREDFEIGVECDSYDVHGAINELIAVALRLDARYSVRR